MTWIRPQYQMPETDEPVLITEMKFEDLICAVFIHKS